MALTEFNAKTVIPGEPLTAQAWNDIVNAMASVYDYLLNSQLVSMRVQIANTGLDLQQVRVTAVRAGAPPVEAVRPIPPDTAHVLNGLLPGEYTVSGSAPGFKTTSQTVTVPASGDLSISLTADGAIMPDVFGQTLTTALGTLKNLNVSVSRILDITGRDVAPENPDAEFNNAPVLLQLPAVGAAVPPGNTARLVIAASLKAEPAVVVPSLAGLSLAEAQKALEALGLVLGKVETKSSATDAR